MLNMSFLKVRSDTLSLIFYFNLLVFFQIFVLSDINFVHDYYLFSPGALIRYIWVLPLVITTALYVPKFSRPSDLSVALLAITPVIPQYCYYAVHGGNFIYIFSVFLGFLTFVYSRRIKLSLVTNFEIRFMHFLLLLVIVVLMQVVLLLMNFRVYSFFEILSNLYAVRASVYESNITSILHYTNSWVYTIIIPFLSLVFIANRNWIIVGCLAAIQFLFFLALAHKTIIISPVIIIAIYFALVLERGFVKLFLLTSCVIVLATLSYLFLGDTILSVVFVRRILFVPAMLNHHYHEFFLDKEYVLYSHSILSSLFEYPFAETYQRLIGKYLFGSWSQAWANTGIFGTGFMHFGYFGIILFCFILGLLCSFIDGCKISQGSPKIVASALGFPLSIIFTSADLFSGLLTNGFLIMMIILILCGRAKNLP